MKILNQKICEHMGDFPANAYASRLYTCEAIVNCPQKMVSGNKTYCQIPFNIDSPEDAEAEYERYYEMNDMGLARRIEEIRNLSKVKDAEHRKIEFDGSLIC
jgi:hypothetical protein